MQKVNELALALAAASVDYAEADMEVQRCKDEGRTPENCSGMRSWVSALRDARDCMYNAQNKMYEAAMEQAKERM